MKTLPLSPLRANRRRKAFTLMELLLVLAIIGLLIGGGAAVYGGIMEQARGTKTEAKLGIINGYLQMYQSRQNGKLPSQSAGLNALVNAGIVTDESELTDAWGNPFMYQIPGKKSKEKYDLFSKGKDQLDGTADDIGNWLAH